MHGFLNVNKPAGITSRAAVDLVKRACRDLPSGKKRGPKVGHTGTLDPIASGVLVVCLGDTTRLAEYIQGMPKTYQATFLIDRRSDTDDIENGFETLDCHTEISEQRLAKVLNEFIGEIEQVPPKYSAAKVDGRRAYKLARNQAEFELKPRTITIYQIDVINVSYPELQINVCCGSGTYIRSLGRDIAAKLGTSAVMSSLVRTKVGDFTIDDAVDCNSLESDKVATHLSPPVSAVSGLSKVVLSDHDISELRFGRRIPPGDLLQSSISDPNEILAGVDKDGDLVALLKADNNQNMLRPHRNFRFD